MFSYMTKEVFSMMAGVYILENISQYRFGGKHEKWKRKKVEMLKNREERGKKKKKKKKKRESKTAK
jgi:hypothetical protein